MDSFINLAKQGYEQYQSSQSDVSKTGGAELNSPHHSNKTQGSGGPEIDNDEAIRNAKAHGSGDSDLFSTALSFLSSNKGSHNEPVDEDDAIKAHDKVYNKGETGDLSAKSLGSAAALQILKQYTSGSSSTSSGSGNSQTQLLSLAMAEASKLFDKSGTGSAGDKQDAVNGAAMTVMKLLVQSKFGGAPTVGGNNSGLSSLMNLAQQYTRK